MTKAKLKISFEVWNTEWFPFAKQVNTIGGFLMVYQRMDCTFTVGKKRFHASAWAFPGATPFVEIEEI